MDWRLALVLATCFAVAVPAPQRELTSCASECEPVYNQKFNYETGKVYVYTWTGKNTIKREDPENTAGQPDTTEVQITANAEIHVLSPCELALKVTGVRVNGLAAGGKLKQLLEESKPLLFEYQDGYIPHVCSDSKDSVWAVNIKRAILSAFQNTMDKGLESHVRETDVNGQCDTHYTATEGGGAVNVERIKNIPSCTQRHQNLTNGLVDPYSSYSSTQSIPMGARKSTCHQVIEGSLLKSSHCEDTSQPLPLFYNLNGEQITHTSESELKYVKTTSNVIKSSNRRLQQSNLLFDHSEDLKVSPSATAVADTTAVLQELCAQTKADLASKQAHLFTKLVYLIRKLNANEIRTLLQGLEGGQICPSKKVRDAFLDAITHAGTEGALQIFTELLTSSRVSGLRARIWLSTLGFVENPTAGAVEAVLPLLEDKSAESIAVLGVTSLAGTFCRSSPDCEKDKSVTKILNKLGGQLGDHCKVSHQDEDKVILALKGFGNVGRGGKYIQTLLQCASDEQVEDSVRIAALEAFRRFPCEESVVAGALDILSDIKEDADIRIHAYLEAIRCPSKNVIRHIKELLNSEVVNQVSRFINSHIENLQHSDSPSKAELRSYVSGIKTSHDLHDGSEFSSNYDASFNIEQLNVGAGVESNVIFSKNSFVPRELSTNVTIDILGRKFNILEASLRLRNLEYLLEHLFGPNGYLTTSSSQDLVKNHRARWQRLGRTIRGGRSKRAASYQPQKLRQLQQKSKTQLANEPEISLSVKSYGNEIRWYHIHNLNDLRAQEDPLHLAALFQRLAQEREVELSRNLMFLDKTLVTPTLTGLPLRNGLNGTASVGLTLKGKFDIKEYLSQPRRGDIDLFVQPSTSLETSILGVIETPFGQAGYRLEKTANSDSAVELKVKARQEELLDVKINLPKKEITLLEAKGVLYKVKEDSEQALPPVQSQYHLEGCTTRIGNLLGVQLCRKIDLPRPVKLRRPSPASVSLKYTIQKTDEGLQGFHFLASRKKNDDFALSGGKLSFNTPGSQKDREYTIAYDYDRDNKKLDVKLRTPIKKLELTGTVTDNANLKQANLILKADDEREYRINGQIAVASSQPGVIVLSPTLEITTPAGRTGVLQGTITREPGRRITFDIKSQQLGDKPVALIGFIQKDGELQSGNFKISTDLDLSLPVLTLHVVGNVNRKATEHEITRETDIKYNYASQRLNWTPHETTLKAKYHYLHSHENCKVEYSTELKSSRFPEYNFRGTWEAEVGTGVFSNLLDLRYGPEDDFHKIYTSQSITWTKGSSNSLKTADGLIKFVHPPSKLDLELKTTTKVESTKLNHNTQLKYAEGKTLTVEVKCTHAGRSSNAGESLLRIEYPSREIVIKNTVEDKPSGVDGKLYVQWQRQQHATVVYIVKINDEENKKHLEADVTVNVYNRPTPLRKYALLLHAETGRYAIYGKVDTPENSWFVDVSYVRPDRDSHEAKTTLKLPWIEGVVKSKGTSNDVQVTMDLTTPNRKIVGSANGVTTGPGARTTDIQLRWDAGRDDSKKLEIHVVRKVNVEDRSADIKATVQLPGRSYKGGVVIDLPEVLFNGQHRLGLELEYGGGKKASFEINSNVDKSKPNQRLSNGQITLNTVRTGEVRIVYNTDYTNVDGRKTFKSKINANGQKLQPLELNIDHTRKGVAIDSSISGKYGQETGRLAVKLDSISEGLNDGIPNVHLLSSFAVEYQLGPKSGKIVRSYHIKQQDQLLEFSFVNYQKFDDRETGINLQYQRTKGDGQVDITSSLSIQTPLENFRNQAANLKVHWVDGEKRSLDAELGVVAAGGQKNGKITLKHVRQGLDINSNLVIDASGFNGPRYDAVLKNDQNGDKINTDLVVKKNGEQIVKVKNAAVWAPKKKSLDLRVDSTTPRVPSFSLNYASSLQGSTKNIKASVLVGKKAQPDVRVDTTLALEGNGAFDGNVKLNVPANDIVDWSVGLKRNIGSGGKQRVYQLSAVIGGEPYLDGTFTATDKPDGIHGEGNIHIAGEEFLTVTVDSSIKEKNNARDANYQIQLNSPNIAFSIDAKILRSPELFHPVIKVCNLGEAQRCEELDFLTENTGTPGHVNRKHHLKIRLLPTATRTARTVGVSAYTEKDERILHHGVKAFWNEESNKQIGYTIDRTRDSQRDYEGKIKREIRILLPTRIVEINTNREYRSGFYHSVHNVMLDSQNNPDRKLTITTHSETEHREGKGDFTVTTIGIKHPDLQKELQIKNRFSAERVSDTRFAFKSETEFDITRDPKKKLVTGLELTADILEDGRNYTLTLRARRPATNTLGVQLVTFFGFASQYKGLGAVFTYSDNEGQEKSVRASAEVNKITKKVYAVVSCPHHSSEIRGTIDYVDYAGKRGIDLDLEAVHNNKVVRRASLVASRRPEINLKYYVDPDDPSRLFRLHGYMHGVNEFVLTADRVRSGQEIRDADVLVKLNTSRLLYTSVNWRPALWSDIGQGLEARLDRLQSSGDASVDQGVAEFQKLASEKINVLREILRNDVVPLIRKSGEKIRQIRQELKQESTDGELKEAIKQFKEIAKDYVDVDGIEGAIEETRQRIRLFISNKLERLSELWERLQDAIDKLGDRLQERLANLPARIRELRQRVREAIPRIRARIQEIREKIRNAIESTVGEGTTIYQIRQAIRGAAFDAAEKISAFLERVADNLFSGQSSVDRLKQSADSYEQSNPELAKFLRGLAAALESIRDKVREISGELKSIWKAYAENILSVDFLVGSMAETADYKAFRQDLRELVNKAAESDSDVTLRSRLQAAIKRLGQRIKDRVRVYLGKDNVWDFRNGKIQFYLPLMVPVQSLSTLGEAFDFEDDHSLSDLYYLIKADINSGDDLPPYDGHAALIGNHHVLTYDGRLFDLSGRCQYVLTQDTGDNNFTVIVDFEDERHAHKQAIIVLAGGHEIQIKPDGQGSARVFADNQAVNEDKDIGSSSIVIDDHHIEVVNRLGLSLLYDKKHDVTVVRVNGFYFGKTAGLFGTYNNEQYDDFKSPEGRNLTSPSSFVESWELSDGCSKDVEPVETRLASSGSIYHECKALFGRKTSPLRSCFPLEDPDVFLNLCLRADHTGNDVCTIAAAYETLCQQHGVEVSLPSRCH